MCFGGACTCRGGVCTCRDGACTCRGAVCTCQDGARTCRAGGACQGGACTCRGRACTCRGGACSCRGRTRTLLTWLFVFANVRARLALHHPRSQPRILLSRAFPAPEVWVASWVRSGNRALSPFLRPRYRCARTLLTWLFWLFVFSSHRASLHYPLSHSRISCARAFPTPTRFGWHPG